MTDPIILDDKARKAVHAQRDAAQAIEVARVAQIQEVADKVTENIPDETQLAYIVRNELENILARGTEQDKAIILARVPFICQDIKNIDARLTSIEGNLTWGIRIVMGAVIMAVLGLIIMK